MESLYIVIPAYNEEKNVKNVIDEWYPVVERYSGDGRSRLVIVNDGSRDSTREIAEKCIKTKPLACLLNKENGGHGTAVLYGYRYAIENKADYIFQTDSDGQTSAKEFPQFWELRSKFEAVIGNRTRREDGASRVFVEKTLLLILKIIFGVQMPDSNAPFRLMKKELVERYIAKLPKDYNLPNVMLTTYFVYFKEKIKFVDISFKNRKAGKNSINIRKIIKIGWDSIHSFLLLKKHIND